MRNIVSRADISSALVCLKGECQSKGALFSFRSFMVRHSLDSAFRRAVYDLKIYNITENRWTYKGLISPELINSVFEYIKKDETEFKEQKQKQRTKRNYTRIINTLKNFDIKHDEIYISVQAYNQNIPSEVIAKGIGVGNGIFFINIKHLQQYESANAENRLP